MNEPKIEQIGEFPHLSWETTSTNKHFTKKIRQRVLEGKYPAETRKEEEMVRDFKSSNLSIAEFIKKNYK
tara:strand:- start:270 stop:479 length:210 start_codon:yes stop_codon:yes gene_type:complete